MTRQQDPSAHRRVLAFLRHATHGVTRELGSAWQTHRQLLLHNPAYAAAVAALAAALATRTKLADLFTALIAGVLAIRRASRRGITQY